MPTPDIEQDQNQHQGMYQQSFHKLRESLSADEALESVYHRYLDGKPKSAKRPLSSSQRDQDFWTSRFWNQVSTPLLNSEAFVLALTRYLRQTSVSAGDLLNKTARDAPESLCRAVRYSQVFLRPKSPRWTEINELARRYPDALSEFLQICKALAKEEQRLLKQIETVQSVLKDFSLLEILLFISLIAFQSILPMVRGFLPKPTGVDSNDLFQAFLTAVESILLRKLKMTSSKDFHPTEESIARSLGRHLRPLFFQPDQGKKTLNGVLRCRALLDAQLAYQDFQQRSLEVFCFDDDYRVHLEGDWLTIYPHEILQYGDWDRDGDKLSRLLIYHHYRSWLSMPSLAEGATWGRPENEAANYGAWVKARRTQAILHDIYGFEPRVALSNGCEVDLEHACLTAEMTNTSCQQSIELPYCQRFAAHGQWRLALAEVMMTGIAVGENRMPLIFMKQGEKAKRIRTYTQDENHPKGRITAANTVLEFLSLDLKSLATQLKAGQRMTMPQIWNWPFLKIGSFLFQIPWLSANRNDTYATINRLRRSGAQRPERLNETHRQTS